MFVTTEPHLYQQLAEEGEPLLGAIRAGAAELLHVQREAGRIAQAREALAELKQRATTVGAVPLVDAVEYVSEALDIALANPPEAALGLGPYVTAVVTDLGRTLTMLASGADPTASLDHARATLRAMPRPETTDLLQVDLSDREQLARVLAAVQGSAATAGEPEPIKVPSTAQLGDIPAALSSYARCAQALVQAPADSAARDALRRSLAQLQTAATEAGNALIERAAASVARVLERHREARVPLSLDSLEVIVACQRIVPMILAVADEPSRVEPAVDALEEQARLLAAQIGQGTESADYWPAKRTQRPESRGSTPAPSPPVPAPIPTLPTGLPSGHASPPRQVPIRPHTPANGGPPALGREQRAAFAVDLVGILPRLAEIVLALQGQADSPAVRVELRLLLGAVGRAAVVAGLGVFHERCQGIVTLSEDKTEDAATLLNQVHALFDDLERAVAGAVGTLRQADRDGGRRWLRVDSQAVEELVTLAGELTVRGGAHEQRSRRLAQSIERVASARDRLRTTTEQLGEGPVPATVVVQLQEIADELSRATDELERARLESDAIALRRTRVQAELEDGLRQMRLASVSVLVPRLERSALGAAQRQGKMVRLLVDGGSTAVDAVALEEVNAALVQLVRNAVEHGIESPEARRALGKPEQGTVRLRAFRDGSQTVMQVIDDGCGIADSLVEQRAAELGYPVPRGLTRERLLQLIFLPGFSGKRRSQADGMPDAGLDLVGMAISGLQGTVAVDSEVGYGTTFTLRVPLVPSLTSAPVVAVAGERYVIPFIDVEAADPALFKRSVEPDGTVRTEYRGAPVRAVDLGSLLGVRAEQPSWETTRSLLLVRHGGQRWLVRVDAVLDRQNLVPQPLGRHTEHVAGAVGTTVLGSGQVALILDLAQLLDAVQ